MKQFADKIKEYREKNGITQSELADKLLVSRQAVSKWEQGRGFPSTALLEQIARLLDTTIDELIASEQDDPIIIETTTYVGWRLKNHLALKLIMFVVPFLICYIYYRFYISSTYNVNLDDYANLESYRSMLDIIYVFQTSASFVAIIPAISLIGNMMLYIMTVCGFIKPKTFKIIFLPLNILVLIINLLSISITSVQESLYAAEFGINISPLISGLINGYIILLVLTLGNMLFFSFEANKAQNEVVETIKNQKQILKKTSVFFLPIIFYVVYSAIFLTSLYFAWDSATRSNVLYTFRQLTLTVGLMINIPILLTCGLYLLLYLKKISLKAFALLCAAINILPILFGTIWAYFTMALLHGGMSIFFAVGVFLTVAFYVVLFIFKTKKFTVAANKKPLQ